MKMKYFIITLFFLSISFVSLNGQKETSFIYGDWYRINNDWIDTRDSRFDLIISKDNSVYFKQELFKNPCSFEFQGKMISDTIFHSSKLYCYDDENIRNFKRHQIDTFLISSLSKNQLSLFNISTKKISEYQKRIVFPDILNLVQSRAWLSNINSLQTKGIKLEQMPQYGQIVPSDSTFSIWKFSEDNNLSIDYGQFQKKWNWTLTNDSILQITSLNNKKEIKQFKLNFIEPWKISLSQIVNLPISPPSKNIIGLYLNNKTGNDRYINIHLKDDFTYALSKSIINNYDISRSIGYFKINNNTIDFYPLTYQMAWRDNETGKYKTVNKFANDDQLFSLEISSNNGTFAIEYKWGNGELIQMNKK
jgi:hypothetical protein